MQMAAAITCVAGYLPEDKLTNADLEKMVDTKSDDILNTGADMVLAGDLGCLMNMAGRLKRRGANVQARHVAEVLAGMTDTPAIGEGEEETA